MRLSSKRILVVGASSSLGEDIALSCMNEGATVIATKYESSKDQLVSGGTSIVLKSLDVCDEKAICDFVESIEPLDGVVLSVGSPCLRTIKSERYEHIEEYLKVGFTGLAMLISYLIKNNKLNSHSSIVIMSSISGVVVGTKGGCLYSATKAALCGFMKSAALELAPQYIRVNCICAGIISTPSLRDSYSEEMIADFSRSYPLGRLGLTKDVAQAAIFLLSDNSDWITGIELIIDGGYCLQ